MGNLAGLHDSCEARLILRVLKELRNEGTAFALQTARPLCGSDDHASHLIECDKQLEIVR